MDAGLDRADSSVTAVLLEAGRRPVRGMPRHYRPRLTPAAQSPQSQNRFWPAPPQLRCGFGLRVGRADVLVGAGLGVTADEVVG
jgi:hypothetical protein